MKFDYSIITIKLLIVCFINFEFVSVCFEDSNFDCKSLIDCTSIVTLCLVIYNIKFKYINTTLQIGNYKKSSVVIFFNPSFVLYVILTIFHWIFYYIFFLKTSPSASIFFVWSPSGFFLIKLKVTESSFTVAIFSYTQLKICPLLTKGRSKNYV